MNIRTFFIVYIGRALWQKVFRAFLASICRATWCRVKTELSKGSLSVPGYPLITTFISIKCRSIQGAWGQSPWGGSEIAVLLKSAGNLILP